MFIFLVLLTIFIILLVTTVFAVSVGGAAFILIFGDVIVCLLILAWLIKKLISR